MNGRLYDPLIGRMLSPDPYIMGTDNTQGYNRYTYALNNPMKFTDPTGEIVWLVPMIFGAYMGGSVANNNFNPFQWNYSSNKTWSGIGTGAITGALSRNSVWTRAGKMINTITTTASLISNFDNGLRILAGRYYTDENRTFGGQLLQSLSRYTWEGVQTWAGYNHSQLRNTFGMVDRVEYFGGATYSINENDTRADWWFAGVSLGNNISINLRRGFNEENHPRGWMYSERGLYWHEYGHTFDSWRYEFGYLPFIGIPSASGKRWTEIRANNHAWNYARRRAFMTEWLYPVRFPLE
jgi:hypothetical protein